MISNDTVHTIGPRLICVLLMVLLLALAGARVARAEPQDLTQARSQAAALEAQLKELKDQAALLREKYDSASARLAQTESDATRNAAALVQAQQDQASAESALNDRLAQIYKQGRSSVLDILLSSTSLTELVDRLTLLRRISNQDAELLRQVADYRAQVADREAALAAQLEEQQAAAGEAEAASQAVTQKLAQTKQVLKGKETEIAQLEKEWLAQQAEQARLERERQAKLQAALADAQAAAQEQGDGGTAGGGDGATGGGGSPSTTAGGTTTTTRATTTTTRASTTTTGGGGNDGQVHHPGVPNVLKPEQIALVAQKAGFSGESLVIAVAVAMAESGSNANAVGSRHTYGLWQILSYAHPDLINPNDPDSSRWYDPYVNATFAWKISSRGTNWLPWSVYKSGAYLRNMDKARAGVNLLLDNPGAVVPPVAK